MKFGIHAFVLLLALGATAAERKLDFSQISPGQFTNLFRSTVTGEGGPGRWEILQVEVPPLLEPLSSKAPVITRRAALAQLSQDPTDERFPLLVLEDQIFTDFKLSTRLQMVSGKAEQMAGIAFRFQDEKNYYIVRASALGNTFRFYKVVNGLRLNVIGPEIPIPAGQWHELTIECKGPQISCSLNGKELIPPFNDTSFVRGKIAFWTKSDSVSYFADTVVTYTRRDNPVETLVRSTLREYPRLLGLEVYVLDKASQTPLLVGSDNPKDHGTKGGSLEEDVIRNGTIYYKKPPGKVQVTMPLRDKNGDSIAAVRVTMRTFTGQTEQNAIVRATPVVKHLQRPVQTITDLVEW